MPRWGWQSRPRPRAYLLAHAPVADASWITSHRAFQLWQGGERAAQTAPNLEGKRKALRKGFPCAPARGGCRGTNTRGAKNETNQNTNTYGGQIRSGGGGEPKH